MSESNIVSVQKQRGRSTNGFQVETHTGQIISVPIANGNRHYRDVLAWQELGNSIKDPPAKVIEEGRSLSTVYHSHPNMITPADNALVWRYMDLAKFISLLDKRALYFSRLSSLRKLEPLEGEIPTGNAAVSYEEEGKKLFDLDKADLDRMGISENFFQRFQHSTLQNALINCWHKSDVENYAMWKIFGEGSHSIAISTNIQSLIGSFGRYSDFDLYVGEVKYIDHSVDIIDGSNLFELAINKSTFYKYENEVRLLINDDNDVSFIPSDEPHASYGSVTEEQHHQPLRPGFYIPINIDMMIEDVWVSPEAETWFFELVSSICEKFGLQDVVPKTSKIPT
jgi:hypothetical protein